MSNSIAIIGMSGRFPGSKSLSHFWENIREGRDLVSHFTEDELDDSEKLSAKNNLHYIKSKAIIEDIDCFDAPFFNISNREAECMDPQQRILLECAWECFESGGYNPSDFQGLIGVFVSSSLSTYFIKNLIPYLLKSRASSQNESMMIQGCEKDFLATKISYKLNLKGPSQVIQTACSSSLVAVHSACQSLLDYESDMALAGGISITTPQKHGFFYTEDGINSPTGCCRPFDIDADGTLIGNGGGLVLLKRLADAVKDGDIIWATIRGSAVNNDGQEKVGYTAPSIQGQVAVIRLALAAADLSADSISYIETHGTGTQLGDSIEIEALKRLFNQEKKQICSLGSLKGNIGHLDAASGVAGLIKTVLALKHKIIPKSGNFKEASPRLELTDSSLFVSNKSQHWAKEPRFAGVSSFGIGGTNVHAILEEYVATSSAKSHESEGQLIFPISAQTKKALSMIASQYTDFLTNTAYELRDIAYTMQVGRKPLLVRKCIIAGSAEELKSKLERLLDQEEILYLVNRYEWDLKDSRCCLSQKELEQAPFCELIEDCLVPSDTGDQSCNTFIYRYLFYLCLIKLKALPNHIVVHSLSDYLLAHTLIGGLTLEKALECVKGHKLPEISSKKQTIQIINPKGEKVEDHLNLSRNSWKEVAEGHLPKETFLSHIASAWESGLNINWPLLHHKEESKKVLLPTYPFEKHRYWIEPYVEIKKQEVNNSLPKEIMRPLGSIEEVLTSFWKKSLKSSTFNHETSFFDLGGDSLIALEICDAIRDVFFVEFSIKSVFTYPTIAEQASHIRSLLKERLPSLTDDETTQILEYLR